MRNFYVTYSKNENLAPLVREISWTKNVVIMEKCNEVLEREFYIKMTKKYIKQAKLAVKDEYIFDFMELNEQHSERELEDSLVNHIKNFLEEMGGNFAFMGNQYRINVGGEDFYIDLLLYHRSLRSLVAIELKIGDFKPEFVGQLQFYLTALDILTEYIKKLLKNIKRI